MRILIALDVTPPCKRIVEEAMSRPWPAGSTFFLVHVLDPLRFVKAPISFQRAKDAAHTELGNLAKCLVGAGWKSGTDVILGQPHSAIIKVATSWKADLMMLGSSDPGPVTRLLLGSTAHSVLRRALCSVEIVRPPATEKKPPGAAMKILVATDGSEYSVTALDSVASRPWPKGSDARSAVDAGARAFSKSDIQVSTGTPSPQDSPARVIVKEAQEWGAQMIVLGSHGRRGFDRLTMGSVSEHVAFHAHCSVEVIRGRKVQEKRSRKGETQ